MGRNAHATTPDVEVTGLTADSRQVRDGFLFAALPGARTDGRRFIADAVARGARVVLTPVGTSLPDRAAGIAHLEDANPRRRLARMAAAFYREQPPVIAAVTGTNGKTSVASFTRQIWTGLGHRAASLGTLGIVDPDGERPGALTTPDPVELHRELADLAARGIGRVALEASSHGLDQYRLDGVRVTAAAFTNLTRDHLDYHGGMSAYLAAKLRLFDEIMAPGGMAVLNADAPESGLVRAACEARGHLVIAYGQDPTADLRIVEAVPHADGLRLTLALFGTLSEPFDVALVGAFQAANLLAAIGLALADGAAPGAALAAAAGVRGVRGRMERVATAASGGAVYVDYAHTPDALDTALSALRPHVAGRLVVVFGCGGDRDRGKRPQMGAVAARLADRAIVTDDNPRGEDAARIRAEALAGCPGGVEIGDRAAAIAEGVAGLGPDDALLVAGKGHETGQIVGDQVLPFDDAEVARAAAAENGSGGS